MLNSILIHPDGLVFCTCRPSFPRANVVRINVVTQPLSCSSSYLRIINLIVELSIKALSIIILVIRISVIILYAIMLLFLAYMLNVIMASAIMLIVVAPQLESDPLVISEICMSVHQTTQNTWASPSTNGHTDSRYKNFLRP
jgi:hypothetical protein